MARKLIYVKEGEVLKRLLDMLNAAEVGTLITAFETVAKMEKIDAQCDTTCDGFVVSYGEGEKHAELSPDWDNNLKIK